MDRHALSNVGAGTGFSRRDFLRGSVGLGVLAGVGALTGGFFFEGEALAADGPTVPIPSSGTAPEQVHLTWGSDPETTMTVSWLSPSTTAQPAPGLTYSLAAINSGNPGVPASTLVTRSFTDGSNAETVYAYHAKLSNLTPGTTYSYQITDGATPPNTYAGTFTTAPADTARSNWAFTSYGDLATPTAGHNVSGHSWNESSDNSYYAVSAIAAEASNPNGAPLFHLLNGDLCYANLNYNSQPAVWRDFGLNVQRSAASVPWMPCLGNHEIEWGANGQNGSGSGLWNGPYGYGQYQTRYELPDNGVDGFHNNWYSFQVGTVLFISLDADDVIYQDGGSYYAPAAGVGPEVTTSGVRIPPGASLYNNQYSGTLAAGPDDSLVPSGATPNAQTTWLATTLASARSGGVYPGKLPIDMIVVQMHQCALSSSSAGNGSDLGIRQAWLPLFDEYGVDLVVSGHEHNYERSYAVRNYNPTPQGTVVAPNPGQAAAGSTVDTRQPLVVSGAQGTRNGLPAFDTSQGTVFLVLGGGGTDGPTNTYGSTASGSPQAKVITQRNQIYVNSAGNYTKNPADSVEPAPWSAMRDVPDAYGYARFDVAPGSAAGDTVITMSYYQAPRTGSGSSYVGTTSYSLLEQIVYYRSAAPVAQAPEFAVPAVALSAAAAIGAGALYVHNRRSGAAGSGGLAGPVNPAQ